MDIKLLNEITRINGLFQTLNESIEPQAIKFVRTLAKEMGEINFKKLFSVVDDEVTDAYKNLSKRGANIAEVETAVEKILTKINYADLAKHLLDNKKLGTVTEKFITDLMEKFKKGSITREEALKDVERAFDAWTSGKGVDGLASELTSQVQERFSKLTNATEIAALESQKILNLISQDAKTLFTNLTSQVKSLKGLGTDITIDVDMINQAATKIMDNSIVKSSDYIKYAKELEKLGIALTTEVNKAIEIKLGQSGALSASEKLAADSLKTNLGKFNRITNAFYEFCANNKFLGLFGKILKKIALLLTGIALLIAAVVKSWGYLARKICNSEAASMFKFFGFCEGSQSTTNTETPSTNTQTPATSGTYSYTEAGLVKYLTDTYGDKGFGDETKFDIVQDGDIIEVTGKLDGKTKKFKHDGKTYNEQN